jgi:hypothetical protein
MSNTYHVHRSQKSVLEVDQMVLVGRYFHDIPLRKISFVYRSN